MSLGIALSIISAALFGASIAMQKYGMGSMKKFSFSGMIKNKVWLAALGIGVIGLIFYLAALSLADLSTVQPMTALTLVVPVISGVFFFKEKVGRLEWVLLAMVIGGIFLVSIS